MRTGLSLAKFELGAASNYLASELNEMLEDLLKIQNARLATDDRDVDDAERSLHRGQFEQFVQDYLRDSVALEFNNQTHPLAVRFVADVGDAVEPFLVDKLGDLFVKLRLVDLVRNLGDDDGVAFAFPTADAVDRRLCTHLDYAAARAVCTMNFFAAVDETAGRKI